MQNLWDSGDCGAVTDLRLFLCAGAPFALGFQVPCMNWWVWTAADGSGFTPIQALSSLILDYKYIYKYIYINIYIYDKYLIFDPCWNFAKETPCSNLHIPSKPEVGLWTHSIPRDHQKSPLEGKISSSESWTLSLGLWLVMAHFLGSETLRLSISDDFRAEDRKESWCVFSVFIRNLSLPLFLLPFLRNSLIFQL